MENVVFGHVIIFFVEGGSPKKILSERGGHPTFEATSGGSAHFPMQRCLCHCDKDFTFVLTLTLPWGFASYIWVLQKV